MDEAEKVLSAEQVLQNRLLDRAWAIQGEAKLQGYEIGDGEALSIATTELRLEQDAAATRDADV